MSPCAQPTRSDRNASPMQQSATPVASMLLLQPPDDGMGGGSRACCFCGLLSKKLDEEEKRRWGTEDTEDCALVCASASLISLDGAITTGSGSVERVGNVLLFRKSSMLALVCARSHHPCGHDHLRSLLLLMHIFNSLNQSYG